MVPTFDITDADAVARHIRKAFRANRSLDFIAGELNRLGVPVPNGAERWYESDCKCILLDGPRLRQEGCLMQPPHIGHTRWCPRYLMTCPKI